MKIKNEYKTGKVGEEYKTLLPNVLYRICYSDDSNLVDQFCFFTDTLECVALLPNQLRILN